MGWVLGVCTKGNFVSWLVNSKERVVVERQLNFPAPLGRSLPRHTAWSTENQTNQPPRTYKPPRPPRPPQTHSTRVVNEYCVSRGLKFLYGLAHSASNRIKSTHQWCIHIWPWGKVLVDIFWHLISGWKKRSDLTNTKSLARCFRSLLNSFAGFWHDLRIQSSDELTDWQTECRKVRPSQSLSIW